MGDPSTEVSRYETMNPPVSADPFYPDLVFRLPAAMGTPFAECPTNNVWPHHEDVHQPRFSSNASRQVPQLSLVTRAHHFHIVGAV